MEDRAAAVMLMSKEGLALDWNGGVLCYHGQSEAIGSDGRKIASWSLYLCG